MGKIRNVFLFFAKYQHVLPSNDNESWRFKNNRTELGMNKVDPSRPRIQLNSSSKILTFAYIFGSTAHSILGC
jgi:hypothetical protein